MPLVFLSHWGSLVQVYEVSNFEVNQKSEFCVSFKLSVIFIKVALVRTNEVSNGRKVRTLRQQMGEHISACY